MSASQSKLLWCQLQSREHGRTFISCCWAAANRMGSISGGRAGQCEQGGDRAQSFMLECT